MDSQDFYTHNVTNNRMNALRIPHQGPFHKLLCVCSAGLLRSPTMAYYFSQQPWNCNTRAAGVTRSFALVVADYPLCTWADTILFSSPDEMRFFRASMDHQYEFHDKVFSLDLPDRFDYREKELIEAIEEQAYSLGLEDFRERVLGTDQ